MKMRKKLSKTLNKIGIIALWILFFPICLIIELSCRKADKINEEIDKKIRVLKEMEREELGLEEVYQNEE